MAWAGQASRRRPWPYDAYIGTTKVILDPGQDGNLVGQKSKTLDQIAPTSYEYGSANPFAERTEDWTELYGGMGELVQPTTHPRRYMWAQRLDASINGFWMKGPLLHSEALPITAGEIRQFVKALHGGAETLFAICQNGVYRRVGDNNWVASLTTATSPALPLTGYYPQKAVRFKGRGSTGDYLWLGISAGNVWYYNGTTWVQVAGAAGPLNALDSNDGQARYLERVGDELWAAGDYWVTKVEEEPDLRAKWSGVIYIGDQSAKITWLASIGTVLYIFKEDGIYTISTAGTDQELFPALRVKRSVDNGRNATPWMNKLWFNFQDNTYTIDEQGQIDPDGLEQMLENFSNVRGNWIAGAGHNTWFMYELYYNPFIRSSFLVKHGTWIEQNTQQGSTQFTNAHHGSIAEWAKKATSCYIVSGVHTTGNDRLYVGFEDGSLEWCVLPQASPNPALDTACEFTSQDSWMYLPIHHANFQADNKFWRGVSMFGPHLTSTEYCEIEYRYDLVNPIGNWVKLTPATGTADPPKFTTASQRVDLPGANPIFSKAIWFRIKLCKHPTLSPVNQTPVVTGLSIHEAVRPGIALQYAMSIKAGSYVPKHNGTVDRRRGGLLRDNLLAETTKVGASLIKLPDGITQEMMIIDFKESMIPKHKRRGTDFLIELTAIQLKALTNVAISTGLTYATLERFTLGQLEELL